LLFVVFEYNNSYKVLWFNPFGDGLEDGLSGGELMRDYGAKVFSIPKELWESDPFTAISLVGSLFVSGEIYSLNGKGEYFLRK